MDQLSINIGNNIARLRTDAKMTQLELAETLNYSDKSVSKWERGEATPDIQTLKSLCDIFDVSVDYMLEQHEGRNTPYHKKGEVSTRAITVIALLGIATLALVVFVVLWICNILAWITFIYAITVELITFLVLHSIWNEGKYNYYIIGALIFSIFTSVYFTFYVFVGFNLWQIWILVIPAWLIVFLCSKIKRKPHKEA